MTTPRASIWWNSAIPQPHDFNDPGNDVNVEELSPRDLELPKE
ncbi:MAG: hypothetical protein ACR2JT_03660 [Nocardioidaceae bacterium]